MRRVNYLLFICVFIFSLKQTYSQIEINDTGHIGIGTYTPSTSYNIRGGKSYFYESRSQYNYSTYSRPSYSYVYESVGIGTSHSSEYTLIIHPNNEVRNVLYVSDGDNKSTGRTLFVNGDAVSTGGWHLISDRRMKKKERQIERENILSKLSAVHGKRYEYLSKKELLAMHHAGQVNFPVDTIYKMKKVVTKSGDTIRTPTNEIKRIVIDVPKFKEGNRYGLAAQDVLAQYPELVSMDDAIGMYAVDYLGFIPLLLEGFNVQQEQMSEMRKQIRKLKNRLSELEK